MKDEDKAKAMKIEKLRKQAEDKSLPMEARNQLKDRANMLEQEMAKKAGVNLAFGGALMRRSARNNSAQSAASAQAAMRKNQEAQAMSRAQAEQMAMSSRQKTASGPKQSAAPSGAPKYEARSYLPAQPRGSGVSNADMMRFDAMARKAPQPKQKTPTTSNKGQAKAPQTAPKQAYNVPTSSSKNVNVSGGSKPAQAPSSELRKSAPSVDKQLPSAKMAKGGIVMNKGIGASMAPHNVFGKKK